MLQWNRWGGNTGKSFGGTSYNQIIVRTGKIIGNPCREDKTEFA